jgi:hypothetical protein
MDVSRRKIIKSITLVAGAAATGLIPGASLLMAASPSSSTFENDFGKKNMQAILIGAGKRGMHFAKHAVKHKEALKIVGIAEPIPQRRNDAAHILDLESQHSFSNWKEILDLPKMGDVVIVAASKNYFEVCTAALIAGYHVWVDRPASMDCDEILALNKLAVKQKRSLLYCYIHESNFHFMNHRTFEVKLEKQFV